MTVEQSVELDQEQREALAKIEDAEDGVVIERMIIWSQVPETDSGGGELNFGPRKTEYPETRKFHARAKELADLKLVAIFDRRTSRPGWTFDEKVAYRTVVPL